MLSILIVLLLIMIVIFILLMLALIVNHISERRNRSADTLDGSLIQSDINGGWTGASRRMVKRFKRIFSTDSK